MAHIWTYEPCYVVLKYSLRLRGGDPWILIFQHFNDGRDDLDVVN